MGEQHVFSDRRQAGMALADSLAGGQFDDPVVFGLPPGGVPVAFEIAKALGAPLDIRRRSRRGGGLTGSPTPISNASRGAKQLSWAVVNFFIAAARRIPNSRTATSCWSTTAWRPARACARR